LLRRFSRELIAAHLSQLEPGYLLSTHPETIGEHLELIDEAAATPTGIAVSRDHLGGMDRDNRPDLPGLLQAITGSLAAHRPTSSVASRTREVTALRSTSGTSRTC
jgi:hypothetical protein